MCKSDKLPRKNFIDLLSTYKNVKFSSLVSKEDWKFNVKTEKVNNNAQTAIEYLLLFAIVATVVLIAFQNVLPRGYKAAGNYYNAVALGIMGPPPPDF